MTEPTTVVWTCVEDASSLCRPSGRKRPPGGAPMHWCDLVNDDLWAWLSGQCVCVCVKVRNQTDVWGVCPHMYIDIRNYTGTQDTDLDLYNMLVKIFT